MRDRCMNGIFNRGKCNDIIQFFCTKWRFYFILFYNMCYFILNKCCINYGKYITSNKITLYKAYKGYHIVCFPSAKQ